MTILFRPSLTPHDAGSPLHTGLRRRPNAYGHQLIQYRRVLWDSLGYTPFGHIFSMYSENDQRTVESDYLIDYFRVYKRAETMLPGPALGRYPPDGATGVCITPFLSWQAGPRATSHKIHVGTTSTPALVSKQAGKFHYTEELQPNTRYFWRIDEINEVGDTPGPLYSFTTGPGYAIDAVNMRGLNYTMDTTESYRLLDQSSGQAVEWFDGRPGSYDISIDYLDMEGGAAGWDLRVNKAGVFTWNGERDDNSWHTADAGTVQFAGDDRVELFGTRNGSDLAAFSRISLVPANVGHGPIAVKPLPGGVRPEADCVVYSLRGRRVGARGTNVGSPATGRLAPGIYLHSLAGDGGRGMARRLVQ